MSEKTIPIRMPLPRVVEKIYEAVAELERDYPRRKFTPDGHMVGSIGEVIAEKKFGLRLLPVGTKGHDAVDHKGRNVQIKLTGGSYVVMNDTCDRLLVMCITPDKKHAEVVYYGDGAPIWQAARRIREDGKRKSAPRAITVKKLRKMSETNPAINRMTDGFVSYVGDEVVYDGEAAAYGLNPLTKVPKEWNTNDGWDTDA
jgi:hypothetical protein